MNEYILSRSGYTYATFDWYYAQQASFGSYNTFLAETGYFGEGEACIGATKTVYLGEVEHEFSYIYTRDLNASRVGQFTAFATSAVDLANYRELYYQTLTFTDYTDLNLLEHSAIHIYWLNYLLITGQD